MGKDRTPFTALLVQPPGKTGGWAEMVGGGEEIIDRDCRNRVRTKMNRERYVEGWLFRALQPGVDSELVKALIYRIYKRIYFFFSFTLNKFGIIFCLKIF